MREEYQGSRQQSSMQDNNIRKNKKYISNKGSYFFLIHFPNACFRQCIYKPVLLSQEY